MPDAAPPLDRLVQDVLRSATYRGVTPDLVRHIGRQELAARRSSRDALKATKSRLHQIYGAFISAPIRSDRWLAEIAAALATAEQPADAPLAAATRSDAATGAHPPPAPISAPSTPRVYAPAVRDACARIMARHASTAERLPILPDFYRTILAGLPPIRAVLDLGCGLNPLAFPWMALPPGVSYSCYDVDAALIAFLDGFFALAGIDGHAQTRDLVAAPPTAPADLALALKLLPTLDQIERDAGATLLRAVPARTLLVSFPARSLCGRATGMPQHYEARFTALAAAEGWNVQRFRFPTELAFLVHRA